MDCADKQNGDNKKWGRGVWVGEAWLCCVLANKNLVLRKQPPRVHRASFEFTLRQNGDISALTLKSRQISFLINTVNRATSWHEVWVSVCFIWRCILNLGPPQAVVYPKTATCRQM